MRRAPPRSVTSYSAREINERAETAAPAIRDLGGAIRVNENRRPLPGVVVIGRNEGERLMRCLASLRDAAARIVYVDSGSSDGSIGRVRAMGLDVVELDPGVAFTAARARNEGFARLRRVQPAVEYVHFVDGDCEVIAGWMEKAVAWLDEHRDVAVVCGRRRERHPQRSIYNMLCDIEWDTPIGEARACGGDALARVAAFEAVGGYRSDLIAGEEPELCLRLRAAGWRIWRLDADMTLHDAAMTRFSQWWKRTLRYGYALGHGVALHGALPERYCVRESRSAWFWGLGVPLLALGAAPWWGAWALALLLAYPLQVVRLAVRGKRSPRENWWRAGFLVLGKFAELLGQLRYLYSRHRGARPGLIEYK
jgi:GT2 family glycosyltransferase